MKVILESQSFELQPESHADKMYIARFLKEMKVNEVEEVNISGSFKYSDSRCFVDKKRGGGYLDPTKIVDNLFDAENDDMIAVEEIEALQVCMHHL